MPGLIRPPFGAPTGPLVSDASLIAAFIEGAQTGHSPGYHIEESTLLIDRLTPVSIRLDPDCLLVRTDIPSPFVESTAGISALVLALIDPPLATVVSLQVLGLPAASWNLWCLEPMDPLDALHRAVMSGPARG